MIMTEEEIAVAKGFELIDGDVGKNWVMRVDTDSLDVQNIYLCPLAQTYGSFSYGLTELGLTYDSCREYGFNIAQAIEDSEDHEAILLAYIRLTRAWFAPIVARRKEIVDGMLV